jgi:D-amino peptidase
MKVLISVDIEGVSGICNYNEVWARQAITDDTNAAIEGAFAGGATEVVVMDSHGRTKDNILWDQLDPRATLIRGGPNTPLYFLEGLDEKTDAVFLVGWHDKAGGEGLLAHAFVHHPFIKLNGTYVGEGEIAAGLAGAYGVPIALVTGDDVVCASLKSFLGDVETAVTKRAIEYNAAEVLSGPVARERIRSASRRALERLADFKPYLFSTPTTLEFECVLYPHAALLARVPGAELVKPRTVRYISDDFRKIFDMIVLWRFLLIVADQFYGNG